MSSFEGLTPSIRILVSNPLLEKRYPAEGEVLAVIDTGYDGFLVVPRDVFESLVFHSMKVLRKDLVLANARLSAHRVLMDPSAFRTSG